MVFLWYGLVPILGAVYYRNKSGQFRRRFDELRMKPILDYRVYRQLGSGEGIFRFIGGFESITDGRTLWIQGENLTIPVSLENTRCWLLPMQQEGETFDPGAEAPEPIRWDRVSTLTEGARVFVGGSMQILDNRWTFVSSKETPLMVIFYDCPDKVLPLKIMRAWHNRNEYWNNITPISLFIGALSQLIIAYSFLDRPAFRLTVICAMIALFIPVLPMIPPGLLFMILYRRLAWQARKLRAYSDLARLAIRRLDTDNCLPGKKYGYAKFDSLPPEVKEGKIPFLIPEFSKERRNNIWHIFGDFNEGAVLPEEPIDPFACFGAIHGNPQAITVQYKIKAYTLEIIAWLALLTGIGLNLFFIRTILFLLWGINF